MKRARISRYLLLLSLGAASASCAAPPPPPPSVTVPAAPRPPLPPTASAAASAEPDPPPPDPCAEAMKRLAEAPRDTADDCNAIFELSGQISVCNEDKDAVPDREVRGAAADCMGSVLAGDLQDVLKALPEAARKRESVRFESHRASIQGYCTLCGVRWGLDCAGAMLTWLDRRMVEAKKGELAIPETEGGPRGKAINGFSEVAKAVCALPKTMWKAKRPPAACEKKVLASMQEQAMGIGTCEEAVPRDPLGTRR